MVAVADPQPDPPAALPPAWGRALQHPHRAGLALLVLLPLLAELGRTQAITAVASAWIWPPSGLAHVYLWVYGRRYWPYLAAGFGISLLGVQLSHPLQYLLIPALGCLAPWVAIWGMGTLADQRRRSVAQTLSGLLLWGLLAATALRSGLNGLALLMMDMAPPHLWDQRLPAWAVSSAMGVLLFAVPAMGSLLLQRPAQEGRAQRLAAWLAAAGILGLEHLRLGLWPWGEGAAGLLGMLMLTALYAWRFGGTRGSWLVMGIALLIGGHGVEPLRGLSFEQALGPALTLCAYVAALGLTNLGMLLLQTHWSARLDLLAQALRGAGAVAWSLHLGTGRSWIARHWTQVSGRAQRPQSLDELAGWVCAEDREALLRSRQRRAAGEAGVACEFRLPDDAGRERWLREAGEVVQRDAQGQPLRLAGVLQDVSAARAAAEALRTSEAAYRTLSAVVPVGIFRTDAQGRSRFVNTEYTQLLGITAEQALGDAWVQRLHPDEREAVQAAWAHSVAQGSAFRREYRFLRADGEWLWVLVQAQPETGPQGGVSGFIGSLTDISQQKAQQALIWQQAHFDALTGLPNRRLLNDRLQQELRHAERNGHRLALLYLDLDLFKEINDTLGHTAGDRLLQLAAERIRSALRAGDTCARLGGDEFTVLLAPLEQPEQAETVAQKLLDLLRQPFELERERVFVGASIGITLFPDDGREAGDLMKHADQAMYQAKALGRNRFCYFTATLQQQAQRHLALTQDLRQALPRRELQLHYQPVVRLVNAQVVKLEALLRWPHPQHGQVPPQEFVPLAEQSGLIHPLGDWVFERATRDMLELSQRLGRLLPVNINKSPRQFLAGQTELRWPRWLEGLGLPAEAVTIEITEGLLLDDRPEVVARIHALAQAGFRLSLDDFGTGYSAMAYLKRFPIREIKIDRSFVRDMTVDLADRAIVEAIVVMAHRLGLEVVAEGVETEAQAALLRAVGCDYAQGWLFGRPQALADLEALWAQAARGLPDEAPWPVSRR
jgi:diguanylate cyclase (GGDEF)-like protein/PAS domain S-box-containing protein